ncbi:MAG TPA: DUF402 domain-containing protein [Gaiellales bacterium]|nr:DUF402 domain-containing protein [Gaiellales bacterium]
MARWAAGQCVVRRETWRGRLLSAIPVLVVCDEPALLAVYVPEGAPFAFPPGDWPTPHPWSNRSAWSGHGIVMLHRPDDPYAVWVFWSGEQRSFHRWYVNFQRPFRRTDDGFETLDHELDLWSRDGREWRWKDEQLFAERTAAGWFTQEEASMIEEGARRVHDELRSAGPWWDPAWASWKPPTPWV